MSSRLQHLNHFNFKLISSQQRTTNSVIHPAIWFSKRRRLGNWEKSESKEHLLWQQAATNLLNRTQHPQTVEVSKKWVAGNTPLPKWIYAHLKNSKQTATWQGKDAVRMENKIRMMMMLLLTRNGKLLHLCWLCLFSSLFFSPCFFRSNFLVFAIVRVELQEQKLTRVNIYFLTR